MTLCWKEKTQFELGQAIGGVFKYLTKSQEALNRQASGRI